jgi:hypothetical protein
MQIYWFYYIIILGTGKINFGPQIVILKRGAVEINLIVEQRG